MYEIQRVPMTSSWQRRWPDRGYTLALQSILSVSGAHPVISWTMARNCGE